jgi:hypothetical protein
VHNFSSSSGGQSDTVYIYIFNLLEYKTAESELVARSGLVPPSGSNSSVELGHRLRSPPVVQSLPHDASEASTLESVASEPTLTPLDSDSVIPIQPPSILAVPPPPELHLKQACLIFDQQLSLARSSAVRPSQPSNSSGRFQKRCALCVNASCTLAAECKGRGNRKLCTHSHPWVAPEKRVRGAQKVTEQAE